MSLCMISWVFLTNLGILRWESICWKRIIKNQVIKSKLYYALSDIWCGSKRKVHCQSWFLAINTSLFTTALLPRQALKEHHISINYANWYYSKGLPSNINGTSSGVWIFLCISLSFIFPAAIWNSLKLLPYHIFTNSRSWPNSVFLKLGFYTIGEREIDLVSHS